MRTSEAAKHHDICPDCGGPVAEDLAEQGYARHKHRKANGDLCTYQRGMRDAKGRQNLEDTINNLQIRVAKLEEQQSASH